MKDIISRGFFWLTFLALCFQTVVLKTLFVAQMAASNGTIAYHYLGGATTQRPTIRWLGESVLWIYEQAASGLISLAYWGAVNSYRFSGSPWGVGEYLDELVAGAAVPFVARLLFYITCCLPLAILIWMSFTSLLTRLIALVLVWGAFVGWPPAVITAFFDFASLFADWPRAYYLYQERFNYHDFAAFAVIACQILYLSYRKQPKLYEVASITILSHAAFEYLGMLFGLAYAARALADHALDPASQKIKVVWKRLAITGAIVVATVVATYLVFQLLQRGLDSRVDVGGFGVASQIENNLGWIRSVIANVITMTALATMAGALAGVVHTVLGRVDDIDTEVRRRQLFVLFGLIIGFAVSLVVGLFTVSYPSEMGRQLPPFMPVFFFLGLHAVYVVRAIARAKVPS